MQTFLELIKAAVTRGADELFLVAGQPVTLRTGAAYTRAEEPMLTPEDTHRLVGQAYEIARRQMSILDKTRDDQFALSLNGISRIRITAYFQRGSHAMAARVIPFGIPEPESLHIPPAVMALSQLTSGLVLFCGPSGCGKSTAAACLINAINLTRSCHILTLETPIEYLFRNQRSFISQRELLLDTADLASGLRAARWLSPEVLYFSDLNIGSALPDVLDRADSSCLVIGGLNAGSPASAVLSLLHRLSGDERQQSALLLSYVLRMIVFETLVPGDGGRVPVFRLIEPDDALRRVIGTGSAENIRRAMEA